MRRERPVDGREALEAYLDVEGGLVPAYLHTLERVYSTDPESRDVELSHEDEVMVRGTLLRCTREGQAAVQFWPLGGEAREERWGFTIEPDQQIPLEGLALTVLSRHEITPPVSS